MIIDIGNILIGKIDSLPFVDKIAGVVKTVSFTDTDSQGRTITKKFPASCQITEDECSTGRYKDLCPEDSKKSVIFLEDNGVRFLRREGNLLYFRATLNTVCWLNLKKIGFTSGCSYAGIAIGGIISKLPAVPFTDGIYQRITINPVGQLPYSQNPFSKYTFDENVTQFLMYPYDYFVLQTDIEFAIHKNCTQIYPINQPDDCLIK